MQSDFQVPDRAFALTDWGEGFWGDPSPEPILALPPTKNSEDTSSEYIPPRIHRHPPRFAPIRVPVQLLHIRETLELPGTNIDFKSLQFEYKGRLIDRCWKNHVVWRKFGLIGIRMNCDVHHMLGRPPTNWRTDARRFVTLRYMSGEGMRELRIHVHSGKTYVDRVTKHGE